MRLFLKQFTLGLAILVGIYSVMVVALTIARDYAPEGYCREWLYMGLISHLNKRFGEEGETSYRLYPDRLYTEKYRNGTTMKAWEILASRRDRSEDDIYSLFKGAK